VHTVLCGSSEVWFSIHEDCNPESKQMAVNEILSNTVQRFCTYAECGLRRMRSASAYSSQAQANGDCRFEGQQIFMHVFLELDDPFCNMCDCAVLAFAIWPYFATRAFTKQKQAIGGCTF
jgi:hypothetical protein